MRWQNIIPQKKTAQDGKNTKSLEQQTKVKS